MWSLRSIVARAPRSPGMFSFERGRRIGIRLSIGCVVCVFLWGGPVLLGEDGACMGLCVGGGLVDEVVAGHLGGLGEAHDVEEGGGDVGEFSVFNFGFFVGGDVDAGDGVEGVGGVG